MKTFIKTFLKTSAPPMPFARSFVQLVTSIFLARVIAVFAAMFVVTILATGCGGSSSSRIAMLEQKVDSLTERTQALTPRLGELMAGVHYHYESLVDAGSQQSWQRAAYEIAEMRESLGDVARYHRTIKNVNEPLDKLLKAHLDAPLDGLEKAITARRSSNFDAQLNTLRTACNNCHKATNYGFIVVR